MIQTNRIRHKQWGLGTKLYELAGGYELLVDFDNHGKIQVIQKDCEEVQDIKLEKINEKVQDVSEINEVQDVKLEKKQNRTCKDVCKKFKAKKPNGGKRYEAGQMRCQICEIYITIEGTQDEKGIYCKCCHYKVRGKPRNRISKELLRNEEVQDVKLEKINETQDVKLEKINEDISKFMDVIKKDQNGILKNKVISELKISEDIFNKILPKILRLNEYCVIPNEIDSENFRIKFNPKIDISETSEKKKIVEAFRLGVVPGFVVQDITVGREKEIKKVEKWLSKDNESLMIIGQYGQGKSHIIRYIREKALDEGYLVAYCDIGEESQMHKPKSVFNTLMKSLVFRDKKNKEKDYDLSDFLVLYAKYLSESTSVVTKNINKFLKPGIEDLIYRLKNNIPLENLYFRSFIDYLCGDEINTHGTYRFKQKIGIQPYQTSASIICNILSSIGSMAASIKDDSEYNFKGLILIFDEGESIDSPAYLSKQRDGGINFIKGLTAISNDDSILMSESISKKENFYDSKYRGGKTNLIYSGIHKDTRFCDQKENHTKCLFAFVEGESEVIDILEEKGVEKIVLNDFTNNEKDQLINKILDIYKKAYDYEINDIEKFKNIIKNKLKNSNNTRSIIKITVEAIDLIRINQDIDYEIILRDG